MMAQRDDATIDRRMKHMHSIEQSQPERFCWASLAMYAIHGDFGELRDAETLLWCELDAKKNGTCWCGKFESCDGQLKLADDR